MRAILAPYDKTGLVDFARGLAELGVELYATGGTHHALTEAGLKAHSISELTGFPEILDGRVKSLHPAVHGGILADRRRPAHMEELAEHGLSEIDIVAVNLYPFEETVARGGFTHADAIENIDIGGSTMIRAAAKNHGSVVVVIDPTDYGRVLDELRGGRVSDETRLGLARRAFEHSAAYDAAIAAYFREVDSKKEWPQQLTVAGHLVHVLRYGENPHQWAALYRTGADGAGIAGAEKLQGIELSYNNTVDIDAAWALVSDLRVPAAAIIKHTNPSGVAEAGSLAAAYQAAYECDTLSAFGGVVALNAECDVATAELVASIKFDCLVAPGYQESALAILGKRKNARVLRMRPAPPSPGIKVVSGGFLVQSPDASPLDRSSMRSVGKREPTEAEWEQLLFAWQVVKHVKSNAIVLARELAAVGVGAGQMSRVESVQIAVRRAGVRAPGSVMASDALFPFPDGVEEGVAAGVTAIIQPGGSVKDAEVLQPADAAGVAMVYTGKRHFRH